MKGKKTTTRKSKVELEKLKKLAYELFFNTEKTQKEIADIVGVSEVTLSNWVADNKWGEMKSMEKASRGATIRKIHERIFHLSQNDDVNSSDAASKWAAVLEKIEQRKITLPNKVNVFKDFDTWLFGKDPELAKKVSEYQYQYLLEGLN
jgi:transposase